MFKRVLLCHDGTEFGRRALKQGAELAISLGAEIHVLIVARDKAQSAAVTAAAVGYVCLVDESTDYEAMVGESIKRLAARGVQAHGHVARGNVIENIVAVSKRLAVDLIVVGQYPNPRGRLWWSGPDRTSLAESVNCAVLIAVNTE